MAEDFSHRWRNFFITILVTVMFLAGLYYFLSTFFPERAQNSNTGGFDERSRQYSNAQNRDRPDPFATYDPQSGIITLMQSQCAEVAGIKIVYHGLVPGRKFKIDAYVLSFDSEMPFHRTLEIKSAKKGFQIGQEKFRLLAAKANRLKLKHLPLIRKTTP